MINLLLLHSPSTLVSSSHGSILTWRSTNQRTDMPTWLPTTILESCSPLLTVCRPPTSSLPTAVLIQRQPVQLYLLDLRSATTVYFQYIFLHKCVRVLTSFHAAGAWEGIDGFRKKAVFCKKLSFIIFKNDVQWVMQVCLISICVSELVAGDFFLYFFYNAWANILYQGYFLSVIILETRTLSTLEDEGMLFDTLLNLTDKTHSNTQDEARLHRYKH